MELIKRGHRLIADDNVIIKEIANELYGTAPDIIRYFMELRGIGIINVKSMYGSGSVLDEKNIQLVILGQGDYHYENFFKSLAERYPNKVRTLLTYNKDLSKRIYAGADIFLMPSRFEPCGLSQMIASRYGAVPIIRETGGLYDTIRDVGWEDGGNGFTFAAYSPVQLADAVNRAYNYYCDRKAWAELVKKVMNVDFSWKKTAGSYIALYDKLCNK
jgi:starch synthase